MKEALDTFRVQLGAAIDSVEFVKRAQWFDRCAYKDRKVRVRIAGDDVATVAIKGRRIGIAQAEFEYEIPIADAERNHW